MRNFYLSKITVTAMIVIYSVSSPILADNNSTSINNTREANPPNTNPNVSERIVLPPEIRAVNDDRVFKQNSDYEPCEDPLVTEAIERSGSKMYSRACKPGSKWGIIDLADKIYNGAAYTLKCGGLAVGTVAACPGLVGASLLSCIGAITGTEEDEEEVPIEVCREQDGENYCTTESVPSWIVSCGLVLPAAKACVAVAKKFDKECITNED